MTRKYSNDIRAEIDTLVPDNTTGQVTPAGIRQIMHDIVDSFTPAYGALRRTASTMVALTTTPTKLVVYDEVVRSTPELVASAANDTITATRAGSYNFSFTSSLSGQNNSDIVMELFRNGLSTPWRALTTTTGAGNRAEITVSGIVSAPANDDVFEIYAYLLSGTDNVSFYDSIFLMETIQTNGA